MTTTMKLTDTYLVILSQAAQRPDLRVLPTPTSLKAKGGAIANVLKGLLRRGLIVEQPASSNDTAWRRDDGGQQLTLVLAPAGLAAIGIEPRGARAQASGSKHPASQAKAPQGDSTDSPTCLVASSGIGTRAGTKTAAILVLIERDAGASLAELMAASGGQAHSVRGFLSATLKKKLGRTITSHRDDDGVRRYRIAA